MLSARLSLSWRISSMEAPYFLFQFVNELKPLFHFFKAAGIHHDPF